MCCDQEASDELKSALVLNKQTISVAPTTLLKNISISFGTMIDNRIKHVHRLLVANSHENHKVDELNQKLSSLLFSEKSSPTCFTSAESSFRTLSMSQGFVKTIGRLKAVILPLIFNTTIQINILGVKNVKVLITAPGTITGTFFGSCNRLRSADIAIDTAAVYQCMKAHCDQVVGEAFEKAALLSNIQSSNGCIEKPTQATGPTKSPIPDFFCGPSQSRDSSTSGSNNHISPL
jgi:hypothetical protein